MKRALSAIERFDLAARVQTSVVLISRARVILVFFTIFVIWLAIASTAPFHETLLVRVWAVVSAVVTVILWLEWRYKLYALAVFAFIVALGSVLSHDPTPHTVLPHTVLGWIAAYFPVLIFVYWGCGLWIIAGRYAVVNSSDWQKEREQLAEWLRTLGSPGRADVVEFATGTFWTGYWNYRIFKPGDCWIIAQFKRGTTKLAGCQVRQSNDVTFTALPSGKWKIDIIMGKNKKSFAEIDVSPQLPSDFEPFVRHVNV